jgi:RNA polymerase sigma factor (sigma-70 family)
MAIQKAPNDDLRGRIIARFCPSNREHDLAPLIHDLRQRTIAPICSDLARGNPGVDAATLTDDVLTTVIVRAANLRDQSSLQFFARRTARAEGIKYITRGRRWRADTRNKEPHRLGQCGFSTTAPSAYEIVCNEEQMEALRRHFARLDPVSQQALCTRYPVDGEAITVQDLARLRGLSETRIRQIRDEAVKTLRKGFAMEGLLDD